MAEHLMGAGEIRDRLGRPSRQRVYQITSDPGFPKPYDQLQMGKVWRVEDVEAWITRMQDRRMKGRKRQGDHLMPETPEAVVQNE